MRLLTAGCVMYNFSAAPEILPVCMTATKVARLVVFIASVRYDDNEPDADAASVFR